MPTCLRCLGDGVDPGHHSGALTPICFRCGGTGYIPRDDSEPAPVQSAYDPVPRGGSYPLSWYSARAEEWDRASQGVVASNTLDSLHWSTAYMDGNLEVLDEMSRELGLPVDDCLAILLGLSDNARDRVVSHVRGTRTPTPTLGVPHRLPSLGVSVAALRRCYGTHPAVAEQLILGNPGFDLEDYLRSDPAALALLIDVLTDGSETGDWPTVWDHLD